MALLLAWLAGCAAPELPPTMAPPLGGNILLILSDDVGIDKQQQIRSCHRRGSVAAMRGPAWRTSVAKGAYSRSSRYGVGAIRCAIVVEDNFVSWTYGGGDGLQAWLKRRLCIEGRNDDRNRWTMPHRSRSGCA